VIQNLGSGSEAFESGDGCKVSASGGGRTAKRRVWVYAGRSATAPMARSKSTRLETSRH